MVKEMAKRARSPRRANGQKRALDGIRVLDLTQAANGPFCMLTLALLGAEVIKIEPPGGDGHRTNFANTPGIDGSSFMLMNHSKKSIVLNLKTDMGKGIFKEMVKTADIVGENFAVGTMDRLGIGYDVLKDINPRLIYYSSKAYGSTGPYKDYTGADPTIQAMSGCMDVNGYPGNPPCKIGPAMPDWATAIYGVVGILAALRLRDITGKGRMVETSMQESAVAFTNDFLQMSLQNPGFIPGRLGNSPYRVRPDLPMPKGLYPCKDGYIYMGGVADRQWPRLLKVIGREDLLGDPRFTDRIKRCEHAADVDAMIEDWVKDKTKFEVMKKLQDGRVSCGAVLNTKEVLEDPHLWDRGFFVKVDHPRAGKVQLFGLPIKISDSPTDPRFRPALLGEHNAEVLTSLLSYSKEDVANLKEAGVISDYLGATAKPEESD